MSVSVCVSSVWIDYRCKLNCFFAKWQMEKKGVRVQRCMVKLHAMRHMVSRLICFTGEKLTHKWRTKPTNVQPHLYTFDGRWVSFVGSDSVRSWWWWCALQLFLFAEGDNRQQTMKSNWIVCMNNLCRWISNKFPPFKYIQANVDKMRDLVSKEKTNHGNWKVFFCFAFGWHWH